MKKIREYFNQDYFDLLLAMTEKEIKARYKGAIAGLLWIFINPFLQMLIIGFVFSFFVKIPNYFLFLFIGLLPWQFFSNSLSKATPSFVYERSLIQKAIFPKESIPISIILSNFFNLIVSIVFLALFLLVTNNLSLIGIIIFLLALAWLLVFTTSFSLLAATLNVRYRDVSFFTQSLLVLWFYATPIIFKLNQITPKYRILFSLNPLTSVFEMLHLAVLKDGLLPTEILLANIAITVFILILSIVSYKKLNQDFVDWL